MTNHYRLFVTLKSFKKYCISMFPYFLYFHLILHKKIRHAFIMYSSLPCCRNVLSVKGILF